MPQVSKSENLQEVGRKIRHYREKKKMSQLELAEAIGVTQNTIYLIETAQSEMKLEKLFRIAEVLDVTPNKLLPGEAKTASNKFFEFEHMMKQLSEADQELIFNMVRGSVYFHGKGSINPKHKEGNCDQRSVLSVFGLWVWKLSDV